jgi:hypothetical protein
VPCPCGHGDLVRGAEYAVRPPDSRPRSLAREAVRSPDSPPDLELRVRVAGDPGPDADYFVRVPVPGAGTYDVVVNGIAHHLVTAEAWNVDQDRLRELMADAGRELDEPEPPTALRDHAPPALDLDKHPERSKRIGRRSTDPR